MSETTAAVQTSTLGLHSLEQYEPFVGAAAIERILKKADPLRAMHLVHISSTFYGGGVTEILTPLTLMMNALGIETGWRMIQGTPEFFGCTKKLHNALQGDPVGLRPKEKGLYEQQPVRSAQVRTQMKKRVMLASLALLRAASPLEEILAEKRRSTVEAFIRDNLPSESFDVVQVRLPAMRQPDQNHLAKAAA